MKKMGILVFIISIILILATASLSWSTPPMPSNEDIKGCVLGKDMFLFMPYRSDSYQGIQKYSINPCSNIPFDFDSYDGKVIQANTALNLLDHQIVCPRDIKVLGSCNPVIFTGCILDSSFFIFKTAFGSSVIEVKDSFFDVYQAEPVLHNKSRMDLSRYEGKKIRMTGENPLSNYSGIDSFTVVPKTMKVIGNCVKEDMKIIARSASGYYRKKTDEYREEKNWQMALENINKAIDMYLWNCFAYWERHDILMNLGKKKEAVDNLYLFDKCEGGYANLEHFGDSLKEKGDAQLAAYAYKKAIELCKDNEKKEQLLGKLHGLQK